jgi:hypothetical protein
MSTQKKKKKRYIEEKEDKDDSEMCTISKPLVINKDLVCNSCAQLKLKNVHYAKKSGTRFQDIKLMVN